MPPNIKMQRASQSPELKLAADLSVLRLPEASSWVERSRAVAVGFFIGVRRSFIDEAHDAAEALLSAINIELSRLRLPLYEEPRELPDVYSGPLFGRSALDHDSARLIVELAGRAVQQGRAPQLELLTQNPYRVAYVPRDGHPGRNRVSGSDRWRYVLHLVRFFAAPLGGGGWLRPTLWCPGSTGRSRRRNREAHQRV